MVHVQDGKWSWLVCVSATLSWLAAMGFVFSFGIFFPVFMDYFNESREKTAWVGSLAMALINFFGLVSGSLVSRFGSRVTTLLGGFFCALSLGLSSLAKNILTLYFTYSVLYGLGASCVLSASLNIISKYFKKRKSLATGIVTCGQGGGVLIMSPVLQIMIETLDWQNTYRIMAGVVLFLCLPGLTYSPNVQSEDAENTSVEMKSKGCHIDVSVWKEPKFVVLVVSASVLFFGHYPPQIHLMRYCEDIGITPDAASRLFVYYGLASCAGRLLSGRLCDFKKVNTFYVYQASELLAGTLILIVTMATTYVHVVIFIVLYGFCDGVFITTLNVLVITCVSPSKVPLSLGWMIHVSALFLASGAPVAGFMADSSGSYTHAFYMCGALVIAGACIPCLLLFTKTDDPDAKTREEESESWVLNDAIDEISVTMNPSYNGEETGYYPGPREKPIVCISSV